MQTARIRIPPIVELVRPLNLLLSVAGVAVGAVLALHETASWGEHSSQVVIAMISAVALASAANAINDAFDVEIDRTNRPDRPIPSGRLSVRSARITAIIGITVGIGLSLLLSTVHVVIATASAAAVVLYSSHLKRYGLIGNLVVSLVVASTLLYGGLATGQVGEAWIGFVAAFTLTLAREIAKDLQDIEGDLTGSVRSLPIVFGEAAGRRTIVVLTSIVIVTSPLPFTHLGFSGLYLLEIAFTSMILLTSIWVLVSTTNRSVAYAHTSTLLKTAMVSGMAGLLLA